MGREMIGERLLILRETEEVVLLANPLRRERRVQRTLAVDEIFVRLELFAADAVPPFVDALVDVPAVVEPPRHKAGVTELARLGRPDEIVERHVEPLPRLAELL